MLRQWMGQNPGWSRWRLSQALATHWDWRNGAGQLKDMAARTLLLKLHQRGLIALPPRRQIPTNRMRCCSEVRENLEWDRHPVECSLAQLGVLTVGEVSSQAAGRGWVKAALVQFHYWFWRRDWREPAIRRPGRPGSLLGLFGVWGCGLEVPGPRPVYRLVGPTAATPSGPHRQQYPLSYSTMGEGASFGQLDIGPVSRRLARDWQAKYGHGIVLLETFVERDRFRGTAYRAANWLAVGATAGRTRQDRHTCIQAPVKDIYLYPLRRDFREALQA